MTRSACLLALLAAGLHLPAAGQQPARAEFGFLVGANGPANVAGEMFVRRLSGRPVQGSGTFQDRASGNPAGGLEARFFPHPRVSVLGGFIRGGYGEVESNVFVDGAALSGRYRVGGTYWLMRAGASFHFDRIPFVLTLGPAVLRDQLAGSRNVIVPEIYQDPIYHNGLSLGAHFSFPLEGSNLRLRVGIDDNIFFWNARELERRDETYMLREWGENWRVSYDIDRVHLLTIQAGMTYTLRSRSAAAPTP